jgi:hypothetical protein
VTLTEPAGANLRKREYVYNLPRKVVSQFEFSLLAVDALEGRGKNVNRQFKDSAGSVVALLQFDELGLGLWTGIGVPACGIEFVLNPT